VTVTGRTPLKAVDWSTPVPSAQVKSAILLAGLRADGRTTVREAVATRDHTERMLRARGVPVARIDSAGGSVAWTVQGGVAMDAVTERVPGDVSAAAFWLVAGAVHPDAELLLHDVGINPTRRAVIDILRRMGADIEERSPGTPEAAADDDDGIGEPLADLLVRSPESVAILGEPGGLVPRTQDQLAATMRSASGRKADADTAIAAVRAIRRHELLRITFADLTGLLTLAQVGRALSDLAGATLQMALDLAVRRVESADDQPLGTAMAIIGMGSLGGREMGYASDADVMFVHRTVPGGSEEEAQRKAVLVVQEVKRLLGGAGPDPQLVLDADLRPEGKSGPLVRSLQSYATYYGRWALTWEFQALLRARPVAGDPGLGADFIALVDPLRWPREGLSPAQVRDIRLMKARVEAERLPRGGDRKTHFKLGLGGITDVAWTVQLIQLEQAHAQPALQVTGTIAALEAAREGGLLSPAHTHDLTAAWTLAMSLRNASVLWRGRPADGVPSDLRDADGVGRIIGRAPGSGPSLNDDYRRVARRSRTATDSSFYDPR